MFSPRGKIGIIHSRSRIELFPELSWPIMTIIGGSHPSNVDLSTSVSPPSKTVNIRRRSPRCRSSLEVEGGGDAAHCFDDTSRSPISSRVQGLVIGLHLSRHVRNHPCIRPEKSPPRELWRAQRRGTPRAVAPRCRACSMLACLRRQLRRRRVGWCRSHTQRPRRRDARPSGAVPPSRRPE